MKIVKSQRGRILLLTKRCLIAVLAGPEYAYLHITLMPRFTYLLLEGEKIEMDVNPDEINTVPIVLDDHLIVYAVASEDDQWRLLELQKNIDLNFTD